jgi:hypothetical protein
MVAPTCFGITLPSSGSIPIAFWEMLSWVVDRILCIGVLCLVAYINEMHGSRSKIPSKIIRQRCAEGFNSGVKELICNIRSVVLFWPCNRCWCDVHNGMMVPSLKKLSYCFVYNWLLKKSLHLIVYIDTVAPCGDSYPRACSYLSPCTLWFVI